MTKPEEYKSCLAHFSQKYFEELQLREVKDLHSFKVEEWFERGLRKTNRSRKVFYMWLDQQDIPIEFAKTINDDFWEIL